MKPYIVCHMVEAVDGRIDCAVMDRIDDTDHYYRTLDSLGCDATIEGKTTLVAHYADPGVFEARHPSDEAGRRVYQAKESDRWAVGVDTKGSLLWGDDTDDRFGRPLIMLLAESVPMEYLEYLQSRGISYITAGKTAIDLDAAVEILADRFGVKRLAVVGGGHLNGSFLDAGLLDEISILYAAGIDARQGMAASFDGRCRDHAPIRLCLNSVERLGDLIWARYTVRKRNPL